MSFSSEEALGIDLLHRQLPEGELPLNGAGWTGVTCSKVCNAPGILSEPKFECISKMDEDIGAMDGCYITAVTLRQLLIRAGFDGQGFNRRWGSTAMHPF
ncbi:hypothetical protein IV203_027745 [Nitzschia inconspicua]|uniref:Uncharacterized protein n=1 Tax=Nitzschia inconspicua TaxID=303405 RepID=A0A9K3LXL8_9STRA|nr:hypothetical protein IV203_027745 [Nitzschia inconspicua]